MMRSGIANVGWLILPLIAACSGGVEFETEAGLDEATARKADEFIAWSGAETYLIARAESSIRVCLQGSGMTSSNRPQREGWVRDAIIEWIDGARSASNVSLITASDITFSCSGQHVTIDWSSSDGRANAGKGHINMFADDTYRVVLHEFGHVFGLGDTYVEGVWSCKPGQQNSVMCGSGGLFGSLQADDLNGIAEVYCMAFSSHCTRRWSREAGWCNHAGSQLHLGDFNGDGRQDMLCHDGAGKKWIDFAFGSGQFNGTNFQRDAGWCNHFGSQLFIGDFNGDGRDDMLCHDGAGKKWIDYADTNGEFWGTDFYAELGWCNHSGSQLFIGDFNGDNRDDMLCHDSAGKKWVALANASGEFTGTSFYRDAGWCNHSGAQLLIGDFNGDNRDDMLCHDKNDGRKWIDHASSAGEFFGTNWSESMGWCNHSGAQLVVADFNADGRDDMLCHDKNDGRKWIAFANTSGNFDGTSRQWSPNWCSHSSARFFVGDFDNNNAADFLCHDVSDGDKWVARQFP